ncbi:hypothetical protein, partial [Gemmobacter lanyuensis]|uniref:hypothetical protein n=1 Tax=Gemmobacter lanyuensis TaxID=1054497 RepID=UPI001E5343E8
GLLGLSPCYPPRKSHSTNAMCPQNRCEGFVQGERGTIIDVFAPSIPDRIQIQSFAVELRVPVAEVVLAPYTNSTDYDL